MAVFLTTSSTVSSDFRWERSTYNDNTSNVFSWSRFLSQLWSAFTRLAWWFLSACKQTVGFIFSIDCQGRCELRGLQIRGAELPVWREGGALHRPLQQPGKHEEKEERQGRRAGGRPRDREEVPQVWPWAYELRRHPAQERGRGPDCVLHLPQVQVQGEWKLVIQWQNELEWQ